jgi:hypothetical protein
LGCCGRWSSGRWLLFTRTLDILWSVEMSIFITSSMVLNCESNIKDFEVSTNAIATIISTTILKFCHNIMVHSISVTVTETVI